MAIARKPVGARRAHVVMPDDVIREVDALVGERRRSRFIAEAVEGKLARQRLKGALAEMDGALAKVDIPGWETPEATSNWVRSLRRDEESDRTASGTPT